MSYMWQRARGIGLHEIKLGVLTMLLTSSKCSFETIDDYIVEAEKIVQWLGDESAEEESENG